MMKLKSVLIAFTFLFFIFFINGCAVPCDELSDCDDGLYCTGEESCEGVCIWGIPPCPRSLCDEDTDSCEASEECWTFEDCDDGDLCTLDQCLVPDHTCFYLPAIECPEGEICNPSTGECE